MENASELHNVNHFAQNRYFKQNLTQYTDFCHEFCERTLIFPQLAKCPDLMSAQVFFCIPCQVNLTQSHNESSEFLIDFHLIFLS